MANKTVITDQSVVDFLNAIEDPQKREDCIKLDQLFQNATGFKPKMWGASIVGYGRYHYKYESGREGEFLATGFSPRKAYTSVYIMMGYSEFQDTLADLGKFKLGKSCMNIKKLDDINLDLLSEIVSKGLIELDSKWAVHPE